MIDPRIYRAALIPVLFAFVLLAFSLENRPQPLRTALAPDAFQGKRAFDRAYGDGGAVRGLSERFPERRPGSAADNRLAAQHRAPDGAGAGLSRAHRRRTRATRSTAARRCAR